MSKTPEQEAADAAAAAKAEKLAAEAAAKAEAKAAKEAAAAAKKAEKEAAAEAKRVEKEAAAAAKLAAAEAKKAEAIAAREAGKMPEQNGIRRPKPDGKCGRAWAIFDRVSSKNGEPASIGEAMEIARAEGQNEANVRAEYARWRKFHGISGRVADPRKEAEKAAALARKEAEKAAKLVAKEAERLAKEAAAAAPVAAAA